MKRKKIQKLITTVLTVAFLANNLSTMAFGITNDDSGKSYSELIQSLKDQMNYNSKEDDEIISKDVDTSSSDMISIIVEFVSEPLATSKTTTYDLNENKVDRDHRVFENFLSNLPSTYGSDGESPSIEYSYKNIFNGVSLKIKGTDIETLAKSGVVKYIHKNTEITVEPPVNEDVTNDTAMEEISLISLKVVATSTKYHIWMLL